MTLTIAGKSVHIGGLIAAVGGVAAIVGALLTWYTMSLSESGGGLSISESADAKGLDSTPGILALVLGIVVIVLVGAWIMNVKIPMLTALVVVAGVLILVVVALSLFTTVMPMHFTVSGGVTQSDVSGKSVMDLFNDFNKALDAAKTQAAAVAGLKVSGSAGISLGFILEAIAGVLVVVGGGLGLLKKAA